MCDCVIAIFYCAQIVRYNLMTLSYEKLFLERKYNELRLRQEIIIVKQRVALRKINVEIL